MHKESDLSIHVYNYQFSKTMQKTIISWNGINQSNIRLYPLMSTEIRIFPSSNPIVMQIQITTQGIKPVADYGDNSGKILHI